MLVFNNHRDIYSLLEPTLYIRHVFSTLYMLPKWMLPYRSSIKLLGL